MKISDDEDLVVMYQLNYDEENFLKDFEYVKPTWWSRNKETIKEKLKYLCILSIVILLLIVIVILVDWLWSILIRVLHK